MTIYRDSQSVIHLFNYQIYHERLHFMRDVVEFMDVRIEKTTLEKSLCVYQILAMVRVQKCLKWIGFLFVNKGRWYWELFHDLESNWRIVTIDSKSCSIEDLLKNLAIQFHLFMERRRKLSTKESLVVTLLFRLNDLLLFR